MAGPILNRLPGDGGDSPERDHHYAFAHHTVRRTFGEDPDFSITATLFMDEGWLRFLWFEDTLPEVVPMPGELGLKCETLSFSPLNLQVALFTLPRPWFTTGAYFAAAAVLRRDMPGLADAFRVWTLERTVSLHEEEAAILGSWDDHGHRNHGPIGEISRESFLAALVREMDPVCGEFTTTVGHCLKI